MKIGFIGLGAMGAPMAKNLVNAYKTVFVYDIEEEARKRLQEQGAVSCTSVAQLAKSAEMILCSLPNSVIVERIMTGEAGVFAHAKKGTIVVDLSSVSPTCTIKMEEIAKQHHCFYADAPVSGGVMGAANATLTIMAGAKPEVMAKIEPVLKHLGKNIYHVGDTGSGDSIKIVNNLLLGCNMIAVAEALTLGQKSGLSLDTILEIVKVSSGNSYVFSAKMENFILKQQYDGGFAIQLQQKDLNLALELAGELEVELPLVKLSSDLYKMVNEAGFGKKDISYLVPFSEERNEKKEYK